VSVKVLIKESLDVTLELSGFHLGEAEGLHGGPNVQLVAELLVGTLKVLPGQN